MESGLHRPDLDLADLHFQHTTCTRCDCHAHRKRPCRGFGSPHAPVVFVLDRLSPQDLDGLSFPGGGPRKAINLIFEYLGEAPENYYFTPPALCPSDPLIPDGRFFRKAELMPLHGKAALDACRPRLHEELRIIDPVLVVALGGNALKALFDKNPPPLPPNVGRIVEVSIQGRISAYAVPVMVTNSLTTLYRTSIDLDPERLWEQTVSHIKTALGLAKTMKEHK